MLTNLKTKKENWTGEEDAVLLKEVEKSKPYLFERAPIHGYTDDFERPWTLKAASCHKLESCCKFDYWLYSICLVGCSL